MPNYEPLISVGMPVYNAAQYIEEAIEGVLNQTYKNIELIICDNCSTDNSAEIANAYAKKNNNVTFIQNNWNLGFTGNAFKATSLCKGELILMHAADDYLMPEAFSEYVRTINQYNLNTENLVLMSDFIRGDAKGNPIDRLTLFGNNYTIARRNINEKIDENEVEFFNGVDLLSYCFPKLITFGGVGSVLISKNLYEKTEGYISNHWFNPDKFFLYKVLSYSPEVVWLKKPLYYYRIHETNQLGQQKTMSVLKQLMDQYAYTFEFPNDFYEKFDGGKKNIVNQFINYDCLNSSIREIASGNSKQGFRNLCFGLSTYPDITLKNKKTYISLLGLLLGPIGNWLFKMIYRSDKWKSILKDGHSGK